MNLETWIEAILFAFSVVAIALFLIVFGALIFLVLSAL